MITSDRLKTTDDRNAAQVALYYRALEQLSTIVQALDDAEQMRSCVLAIVAVALGSASTPPAQVETPAPAVEPVDVAVSASCSRCGALLDVVTGVSVMSASNSEQALVCSTCRDRLISEGWYELLRAKA